MIKSIVKIFIALLIVALLIAISDAATDGHKTSSLLWRIISAIGYDIWAIIGHFWDQSCENLRVLSAGTERDKGFNIFRWFLGGPIYIFGAFCQTIDWWLSNGRAVEGLAYIVGVPLMTFVILPHLGNISLSSGGKGDGHSKSGGGHR